MVTDLKRSIRSPRMLASILLVAAAAIVAVLTNSDFISTMQTFDPAKEALPTNFCHSMMREALTADTVLAVVPIAAALPFSCCLIEDIKSGFYKHYLPHTNRKKYVASKVGTNAIASALAVVVGLFIAYAAAYAYFMPLQEAYTLAEEQALSMELFKMNIETILRFIPAAVLWASIALTCGTAGMDKFLSYISPFISYYILVIVSERYFRDIYVLNPKNYLRPVVGWPSQNSALILSCCIAVLLLMIAFAAVSAKVADIENRGGANYREKPLRIKKPHKGKVPAQPMTLFAVDTLDKKRSFFGGLRQDVSESLCAMRFNFHSWKNNPRIALTFAFALILTFLLTDKVATFAYTYGTTMQMFEPFVWTFGDSNSILLMSLLLLLLFSDVPNLGSGVPYYLIRMKRRTWLIGQMLYVIAVTILFCLFVLAATTIMCMQNSFIGNLWSETAAMLGYSGEGQRILLPAFVKTLEMSKPLQCMLTIVGQMTLYTLLVVSIMLLFNLLKGRVAAMGAVFAFSLYGFILNPQTVMTLMRLPDDLRYRANVFVGWISPLNHATYHMHNFGYDKLPTLTQSNLIFGGLIILMFILCLLAIKRYSFSFTSGDNN